MRLLIFRLRRQIHWKAMRTVRFGVRHWPILIISVAALVAMTSWWKGQELVWGIDANFPLNIDDIGQYFRVTDAALGAPDVRKLPFALPAGALLWIWGALGIPYDPVVLQRLFLFILLLGAGCSMYGLIRISLPALTRLPALGGALFYIFNLYALTVIWTPLSNLVFHYSLLPLVLVVWLIAFRRLSVGMAVAAAVIWSLTLTPAYVTTPVVVTDLVLLTAVAIFQIVRAPDRRQARRIGVVVLVIVLTWVMINAFWVVPTLLYYDTEVARGLAAGTPADLFELNSPTLERAIRLGGYWGLTSGYRGSAYFPWSAAYENSVGLLGFVLPLIAVFAFFQRRQRSPVRFCPACGASLEPTSKEHPQLVCAHCGGSLVVRPALGNTAAHLRFFAILLVISLVLVTGPNEPLGQIKSWALSKFSALAAFRGVYQRFMAYASLAYAPLVAGGLYVIGLALNRLPWSRFRRRAGPLAQIGLIGLLAVGLAFPMWNGSLFDTSGVIPSRRITIPPEYERVAQWLDRQDGDFVVLTYPYGPTSLTALDWKEGREGYLGVEPLQLLSSRPFLLGDPSTPYLAPLVQAASEGTAQGSHGLSLMNVRYVVVHLDANADYLSGLPAWIGVDGSVIEANLSDAPGLVPRLSDGELRVFEVTQWRPFRLFAVRLFLDVPIFSLQARELRRITYTKTGLDSYQIPDGEVRSGELLIVNHPYDEFWRANGQAPIKVKPGLTGFLIKDPGPITVEHLVGRRYPVLLVLTISLMALLVLVLLLLQRRRTRTAGGRHAPFSSERVEGP